MKPKRKLALLLLLSPAALAAVEVSTTAIRRQILSDKALIVAIKEVDGKVYIPGVEKKVSPGAAA